MFKIRKIKFKNHPVLGSLELNFCGQDNKAVDTVIFAGANGTGKSMLLNALYNVATQNVEHEQEVELENETKIVTMAFYWRLQSDGQSFMYVKDNYGMNCFIKGQDFKNKYALNAIYSDVDINFQANTLTNVTSLNLDEQKTSRKSATNLPTEINQLLIDVQAMDDSDIATAVREIKDKSITISQLPLAGRMTRFTTAFNQMFEGLEYSRIENKNKHKVIIFRKNGAELPIEQLSSGEKQIVYRGCFLLKDVNALKGAFVLIDEPEISLHPIWQQKILDYYKDIFTSENGVQTSQLFVATHSPFIIHNDKRNNDKVIVLTRDTDGNIVVKDKPEYYKCSTVEAVEDAFFIQDFEKNQKPTVYVEGRTDEKYFNKAIEIYGLDVPFQFKWVGYLDQNGQEVNTGKDAVQKAFHFLVSKNLNFKNVCLLDCDTNQPSIEKNNVVKFSIPKYNNDKKITVGIENALIFGDFDIVPFVREREKENKYGMTDILHEFDKMACCNAICCLEKQRLEKMLVHLKEVILQIEEIYVGK